MNDATREFVLAPSGSASEALGKVPKCYVPAYVQEQHERELKTRWRINSTQPKKGGGTERRMWKQDMKEDPSNAAKNVNSTLRLTEDKLVRPNSVLLSNLSVSAKEKEDKQYKEVELRVLRDRLRFKQKGQRGGSAGSSSGGQRGSSPSGSRLGSPFGSFLNATVLGANDAGARDRRAAGWVEKKSKASRHAPILIQSTKLYGGLQKAWRSGDVQHTPFSTLTPASGTVQDIHRPILVDSPATPGTSTSPKIHRQLVLDQHLQDPRVDLDGECSSSSDDGHRKAQGANKLVTSVKKKSPLSGKVNHNGGVSSSDDETVAADNKAKARVMLSFDMEQIGGGQFAQVGRSASTINSNTNNANPHNQASRDTSNSKLSKKRAERKMQKDLRRFEAYNPNVIMPSLRDQMSKLAFSPTSTNKVDSTASLDISSLGSLPTPQDNDLSRGASSSHLAREAPAAQSPQRAIDRLVFEDSSDEEYFVETINRERDRLERKIDSRAATNTRRAGLSTRSTNVVPQHLKPIDHGNALPLLQSNGLMQQKSHDQIAKDLTLRASTYFPESDLQRLTEETERLRGQNSLPRTGSTVYGGIRRVESSAQLVRRVSGLGQFLSNADDQTPPKAQKSVNFVNSINPPGFSPSTNSLLLGESTPTAYSGGVGGILKQQPILSDITTVDTPNGSHTVSPNASFSLRPQQSLRLKAQVSTRGPSPTHTGPISLDPSDASSILRELYYVSCPTHEDREGAYVSALGGLSFNMDFPKFKKLVRGLIPHPTSGSQRGSSLITTSAGGGGGCQHYQPISDDVALSMFAVIIENSSHLQQSAHTFLPQGGHGGQRSGSQQQGGNISAMMEASIEETSSSPTGNPIKLGQSVSLSTASNNPPVNSPFGHRQLPSGLSASSTLPPALQVTITYVRFLSGLCQSVLSPAQLKFVDDLYVAVVNSPHVGYYLYHLKYQVVHRMRAKLEILRQHRAALQQAMQNEMDGIDTSNSTSVYAHGKQVRGGGTVDVLSSATSIPSNILDGFDPENWLLVGSLGDRMPIPSSALSASGSNGGGIGNTSAGRTPGGIHGNHESVDTPRRNRLQRTNSVASTNSRVSSINGASPSQHHSSRSRVDVSSPSKRSPRNGGRVAELNYAQMIQDRLRSEVTKLMTLASSLEFTLIGDPLGDTLRVKSYFITRRRNRERVQHLLHEQQQQQRRVALEQLSRKQQEHRKKLMRKQHRHGDDDDDDDEEESGLEAELLALMEESMINFDVSKGSGGNADDESLNLLALAGGVHDELLGGPDCVALQRSAPVIPSLTKLGAVFIPPTAMTTPGGPSPNSKRLLTPIAGAPTAAAGGGSSPSGGGGYYNSLSAKPPAEAALVNYFRYRKETDIISDIITTLEAQLDLMKTRSAMVSGRPGSGGGSGPGAAGTGGGGLQGGLYTVAAMDDVFRAPQNGVSRVGNGGSRSPVTGLYQPFTPGEDVSRPDMLLSLFLPGAPPKPADASSSTPSLTSAAGRTSSPAGSGRRDSMMVTSMSYDEALVGGSSSTHATESPLATLSVIRPGVKFATFVVRDAVFNLKGVSMQFPHPEEDAFVAAVMNCLCEAAIDTSAHLLQDQLNIRTAERECEEAEEKALVALEAALRSSLIGEDIAARDGPHASSTHSPIRHHSGGGTFGSRSVMSENESQNSHSTQSRGGGSTPIQKVRVSTKGSRPIGLSTRPPASTLSTSSPPTGKRVGTASSVGTRVTGMTSVASLSQMTTQGHATSGKSNAMGGGNHQGNPWSGQTLSEKSKHYNTAIYEAAPLAPPPLAHLSLDDFRMLLFCDNNVMNALFKIVPPGPSPVSGIFGPPPAPPS